MLPAARIARALMHSIGSAPPTGGVGFGGVGVPTLGAPPGCVLPELELEPS